MLLCLFQNITKIVKNKLFFTDFKWRKLWHYLVVKKLSALLRGTTSKNNGDFIVLIAFIPIEQKANLNP